MASSMESDSYCSLNGHASSYTGAISVQSLDDGSPKKHYLNSMMRLGHQGSSAAPLGPVKSGSAGNFSETSKVDDGNEICMLPHSGDYSSLSQLNQDMLGRRHSVDSNIGRSRQPTFVRTYREVKWKRVNKPTKLPPILSSSAVDKLEAAESSEAVGEPREYIMGTHIIRQRVPIFKTNGDSPSMTGRRFSADDLIPVTGLHLNMAPNAKCLVIRDDSPPSRKGSTSSSEDMGRSSPVESRQAAENADSFYEFCLIDEDDEDGETTDDGTDEEEDGDNHGDNTLLFKNTAIEYTPRTADNSSTLVYSFSAPAIMSSAVNVVSYSSGQLDLRRLVLKNMQMKKVNTQPSFTNNTEIVSDSSSVEPGCEAIKSAVNLQNFGPFPVTSETMQPSARLSLNESNYGPLITKPASISVLDHSVGMPFLNKTAMSPFVTPTHLMPDKALDEQSHTNIFQKDASEVKPPAAPGSAHNVTSHPVPGKTSWVLTSTKIADANVYVSYFHPPNSKVRVRKAHWGPPHLIKGTVPIDVAKAKVVRVEHVAVPTTSGGEPLIFQRVTYSSGDIYRSSYWAAPSKSQAALSGHRNALAGSGLLHTSPAPRVSSSVNKTATIHLKVAKMEEMQTNIGTSDLLLTAHPLSECSNKNIGVQGESSVCHGSDYISSTPVTGNSSCTQPSWKSTELSLHSGVNFQGQSSFTNSGVLPPSFPLTSTPLQWPLMSTDVKESHPSVNIHHRRSLPTLVYDHNMSRNEISKSKEGDCTDEAVHLSTTSGHIQGKPASYVTAGSQILSMPAVSRDSRYGIYINSGTPHTAETASSKVLPVAAAGSCQSQPVVVSSNHVVTSQPEKVESLMPTNKTQGYISLNRDSNTAETQPSPAASESEHHISPGQNLLFSDDDTHQPGQVLSKLQHGSDLYHSHDRPTDMNTGVKTQAISYSNSNGLIQSILSSISDYEMRTSLRSHKRGGSSVAIDNKIEQAMDLVKRHLMYAVREEVEILKQQIGEMMERIGQLEYENTILRSEAKPETLNKLQQPRASQTSQTALPGQNASIMSMPNLQQPQQTTPQPVSQSQPSQPAVQPVSQQQASQSPLFQTGQSPL